MYCMLYTCSDSFCYDIPSKRPSNIVVVPMVTGWVWCLSRFSAVSSSSKVSMNLATKAFNSAATVGAVNTNLTTQQTGWQGQTSVAAGSLSRRGSRSRSQRSWRNAVYFESLLFCGMVVWMILRGRHHATTENLLEHRVEAGLCAREKGSRSRQDIDDG